MEEEEESSGPCVECEVPRDCSTVQYSTVQYRERERQAAVEEEEESSRLCVEWKVPRELLLHRDQLIPPPAIGFERFEENIWKI